MTPLTVMRTPIGVFASVVFLAAVAAIIFERALNDIVFDHLNSWSILGLAVMLVALTPLIVHRRFPPPPFWLVGGVGVALFYYGYNLGVV